MGSHTFSAKTKHTAAAFVAIVVTLAMACNFMFLAKPKAAFAADPVAGNAVVGPNGFTITVNGASANGLNTTLAFGYAHTTSTGPTSWNASSMLKPTAATSGTVTTYTFPKTDANGNPIESDSLYYRIVNTGTYGSAAGDVQSGVYPTDFSIKWNNDDNPTMDNALIQQGQIGTNNDYVMGWNNDFSPADVYDSETAPAPNTNKIAQPSDTAAQKSPFTSFDNFGGTIAETLATASGDSSWPNQSVTRDQKEDLSAISISLSNGAPLLTPFTVSYRDFTGTKASTAGQVTLHTGDTLATVDASALAGYAFVGWDNEPYNDGTGHPSSEDGNYTSAPDFLPSRTIESINQSAANAEYPGDGKDFASLDGNTSDTPTPVTPAFQTVTGAPSLPYTEPIAQFISLYESYNSMKYVLDVIPATQYGLTQDVTLSYTTSATPTAAGTAWLPLGSTSGAEKTFNAPASATYISFSSTATGKDMKAGLYPTELQAVATSAASPAHPTVETKDVTYLQDSPWLKNIGQIWNDNAVQTSNLTCGWNTTVSPADAAKGGAFSQNGLVSSKNIINTNNLSYTFASGALTASYKVTLTNLAPTYFDYNINYKDNAGDAAVAGAPTSQASGANFYAAANPTDGTFVGWAKATGASKADYTTSDTIDTLFGSCDQAAAFSKSTYTASVNGTTYTTDRVLLNTPAAATVYEVASANPPAPATKGDLQLSDFSWDHVDTYNGLHQQANVSCDQSGAGAITTYYVTAGSTAKTTSWPKAANRYTVYIETAASDTYNAFPLTELGTYTMQVHKTGKPKLTAGNNKLTVSWKNSSTSGNNVSYYRVYYKVSGGSWKYKTYQSNSTDKVTLSGLKNKKKYSVKVVAYRSVSGTDLSATSSTASKTTK
ncbi:MAG: fibronectin type III domain-containing protein [Coriobacteriales bacterium]|jgi:hypothetical protein|nr:fibronectin type III domain-containing protein [Coriobacteriales bacterium]